MLKSDYLALRNRYTPEQRKTIRSIVLVKANVCRLLEIKLIQLASMSSIMENDSHSRQADSSPNSAIMPACGKLKKILRFSDVHEHSNKFSQHVAADSTPTP